MRSLFIASNFVLALTSSTFAQQPLSDTDYIKQAVASAPESIAKNAAVVRPEHGHELKTLREGTNGFTCMIMGTDRMCADAHALEFIHAMMAQKPPPANQLGIAYMLGGDTGPQGEVGGASDTDPSATEKRQTTIGSSPALISCCSDHRPKRWAILSWPILTRRSPI
jgi:hypothetical protein